MNILIIEDNAKLAENVADVLRQNKYTTDITLSGNPGLKKALQNNYDLIILDLNLPDIDGIELCKTLRKNEIATPILMLTARINLQSKVEGLDCGADDYFTKPFMMDELLARVRALLRRNSKEKSSTIALKHNFLVDLSQKQVSRDGTLVNLSPTEFMILEYLAIAKGTAKTPVEIYEAVWGSNDPDILMSDTLKVHIAGIRKKLGNDTIETVRGQGYMIR